MGEGWYQNVKEVMDVMTITDDDDVGGDNDDDNYR